MLIQKKPETEGLEIITMVRCVCCNCDNEDTVRTLSVGAAAIQLQKLGWRTYETDYEIGGNTCPKCIKELNEIEIDNKLKAIA